MAQWIKKGDKFFCCIFFAILFSFLTVKVGDSASIQRENDSSKRAPGFSWSELESKYEGAFILSVPHTNKNKLAPKVALTFDDVPDPKVTPDVLNILSKQKVKATFFVIGNKALNHPDILRRIYAEGHNLGNHSYDHPHFPQLTVPKFAEQISKTEKVIWKATKVAPRFIRPPYGEIMPWQVVWGIMNGYTIVNWDVDSSDWMPIHSNQVLENITRNVKPGSIILLHAASNGQSKNATVSMLPHLINWLHRQHYKIVPLTELLRLQDNEKQKM